MTDADFVAEVERVVRSVGSGEVMTYGEVAAEAGFAGAARAVGNVLRTSEGLPWWRIVAANGRLVPGKEHVQGPLLTGEGVDVADGRVRMGRAR